MVIERALLRRRSVPAGCAARRCSRRSHGCAGVELRALPRLDEMRQGRAAWPAGADLDDLLALVLREVEALVRFIDGHGR